MRARANLVMRLRHLRPVREGWKKKVRDGGRRRENIGAGHVTLERQVAPLAVIDVALNIEYGDGDEDGERASATTNCST